MANWYAHNVIRVTNEWQSQDMRIPIVTGGGINYFNGLDWETKPIKYWDGISWIEKPLKYWDGLEWILS